MSSSNADGIPAGKQWQGGGVPQLLFELRGAKLYDPRKDSTSPGGSGAHRWGMPSTYQWTENLEVARYNYLRGIAFGGDGQPLFGVGLAPTAIDLNRAVAAMNSCDEIMTLQFPAPPYGFTTEYRYRVSAVVSSEMTHRTVLEKLALACGGDVPDLSGRYALTPGMAQIAVASISDDDLLVGEELVGSRHTSRREKANEVVGQWSNPEALYQRVDVPARWSDIDEELDGGFRNAASFDLEFVASQTQGQRVLEIMRRLERRQQTYTITLSRKFAYLEAGDWIVWNFDVFGLVAAQFRVEQVTLHPDWRITLNLREIDNATYAWDPATDEIDPANPRALASGGPDVENVDGFAVAMVTVTGPNGEQIPGLQCTWTAIVDPTVVAILIEYRRVGDTPWKSYTWPFPPSGVVTITDGIIAGAFFEARATPITDPPRRVQVTVPVATGTVAPTMIVNTVVPGGITMTQLDEELQDAIGGITVDTDPPATPTGLTVTSIVQRQSSGELVATVVATVNPNANPNFLENEFEVSKNAGPFSSYTTHGNRHEWTAFLPGTALQVRARAWSANGFPSPFSANVPHTVAASTTPPGNVTALTATTGLRFVSMEFTPPADADLEAVEIHKSPINDRTLGATLAARVAAPGKFAMIPMLPGEIAYFWAIARNTSGLYSAQWFPVSAIGGVEVTMPRAIADDIADAAIEANKLAAGAIDATKFATSIKPVEVLTVLPDPPHIGGRVVFLTSDAKLYRNSGFGWTVATDAVDIVASWITAGAISAGAISTTELAAGAVTADKIGAQAITAGKLAVTSYMENLCTNGDFFDGLVNWSSQGGSTLLLAPGIGITGTQALRVNKNGSSAGSAIFNRHMPVEGATPYEAAAHIQIPSAAGVVSINVYFYDSSLNLLTSQTPVNQSIAANVFTRVAAQLTTPAGAKFALIEVQHSGSAGVTHFWADAVSLRKTSGATLIQNGAITTEKMTANTINGNVIAAGTLSADKIAALSITAGQIAANAIETDKIAATAVTTTKLAVGAVGSSTQIADGVITTNKMVANSISGDRITAGTLNSDKIAANTITSAQLSTTELITVSAQIKNLTVETININTGAISDIATDENYDVADFSMTVSPADKIVFHCHGRHGGLDRRRRPAAPSAASSRFIKLTRPRIACRANPRLENRRDGRRLDLLRDDDNVPIRVFPGDDRHALFLCANGCVSARLYRQPHRLKNEALRP